MAVRLTMTYIFNLFDLWMTNHWVSLFGVGVEANPVGRWLYGTGLVGPFKMAVMAVLFLILGVCIRLAPRMEWISWVVFGAYGAVVLYHGALLLYFAVI